jgi:hypothetical protein
MRGIAHRQILTRKLQSAHRSVDLKHRNMVGPLIATE